MEVQGILNVDRKSQQTVNCDGSPFEGTGVASSNTVNYVALGQQVYSGAAACAGCHGANGGGGDGPGGAGSGGSGGGGSDGGAGTTNRGGGGGGGNHNQSGGNGGSGIVVVRGPSAVTFTVSPCTNSTSTHPGGDKIATFTVSGT